METSSKFVGAALGGLGSLVTAPLRHYLTQLVHDQLAFYVREDCMDFERLTLNGTFTLQNLELKLDVLRDTLGIPLTYEITRAFVRTLQVNVPWTNLLGQPISVKIDTVMISLRLKTDAELQQTARATASTATSQTTTHSNNQSSTDSSLDRQPEPEATEDGWITSLVKRCIANTSLSIKDVIFKFDDGDGRVLTATLNSLNIFSADPRNRWSVSNFFEPEGPQKRVCKAASARGLSIRLDRSTEVDQEDDTTSKSGDSNSNSNSNSNSSRRKKRKHKHEVPVLRRANISVRGWFSLAPVHVEEKRSKSKRKMDHHTDGKSGDPFAGYNGWHNGREEVRGHPATVMDIHCSRLRFALSETQVDTMMKINEKVAHATVMLENAMEHVREQNSRGGRGKEGSAGSGPGSSTTSTSNNHKAMTTEDVKAMLDAASYKVQQEEQQKKRQAFELDKTLEKQHNDDDSNTDNESDGGGGGVTGLLSWAWNSLVGEDEDEEEEEDANHSKDASKLIRSFRVIGFRLDHIGLDFLLHVRGHKLSDQGPLHLRYPPSQHSIANRARTPSSSPPPLASVAMHTSSGRPPLSNRRARTSSETATVDEEDVVADSIVLSSPPMSPASPPAASDSLPPNRMPASTASSPQHIVKVRTPGGYVEVDMSDSNGTMDGNNSSSTSCATDATFDTSQTSRSTSNSFSSRPSTTTSQQHYVSREGYHARHSRERVEAFASLQFSGIEYETRSHTVTLDRDDAAPRIAATSTIEPTHTNTNTTTNTNTQHSKPPQEPEEQQHEHTSSGTDTLSLFEIRSISMWSTTEMTRCVELSKGKHVTLPNYLLLCGECALHDCDGAGSEDQTRLSSLSTASLSPPPSPATHPSINSPRVGQHHPYNSGNAASTITPPPMRLSTGSLGLSSLTSSASRSLLQTPQSTTPSSSTSQSSSASSRRNSTAWLEWVAQPFLPRRIGLNLPPPQESLPPMDELVKDTSVSAQGRAFRMRTVVLHSETTAPETASGNEEQEPREGRTNANKHTSIAVGHCTARLDPEWIADMRVILNPMFANASEQNSNHTSTKTEKTEKPETSERTEQSNEASVSHQPHTTFQLHMQGIGMWMVLEAPLKGNEKPSWCLLESKNVVSESASAPLTNLWSYTFEHVCLCTGTLTPGIGETGFHRGLAAQLATFHVRQNVHDTPKYWQLQSTGLFRTDYNTNLPTEEIRANKWPTYTMSSTNEGALVESTRKDVIVVQNVVVASTRDNRLQLQKGGQWNINVDAAQIPFLTACYSALVDTNVAEEETLYWVRMAENVAVARKSSSGMRAAQQQPTQLPTPLEEEVVRLRVLLHEAREEAERWKALVENGLSQ